MNIKMIIDRWYSLKEIKMLKKWNHPCLSNSEHSSYAAFSSFPNQNNVLNALSQLYTYSDDFDTDWSPEVSSGNIAIITFLRSILTLHNYMLVFFIKEIFNKF